MRNKITVITKKDIVKLHNWGLEFSDKAIKEIADEIDRKIIEDSKNAEQKQAKR